MPSKLAVSLCCFWIFYSNSLFAVPSSSRYVISTTFAFSQSPTIIINEYLADPATGTNGDANGDGVTNATQDEFVELVNTGALPLDISGLTISDSTQIRFTLPSGKIIPPGESAVIFGGGTPTGDFGNAAANGLVLAIGGSGLSLNNGGDSIIIKNSLGIEIARQDYPPPASDIDQSITRSPDITGSFTAHTTAPGSSGTRFSPGTLVSGRPFVSDDPRIDSISPDTIINTTGQATLTVNGDKFQNGAVVLVDGNPISTNFINVIHLTADIPLSITTLPGAHLVTVQNPDLLVSNAVTFTVLSAVGINEYLADPPDGPAGDANGDGATSSSQDEFIEVINRSEAPVDISGFSLSDTVQIRFTFPAGTVIPAGEAAVIFGGGTPSGEFGNAALNHLVFTSSLSLNNTGDTITLRDAAGNTLEQIIYGSTEGSANQSVNRNPETVGVLFTTHSSITGSAGRLFSPGTLIDGTPFTTGPRITEISPASAPLDDQPLSITIRGNGFETDSRALVDGLLVSAQFITPGEMTAIVPASVAQTTGAHAIQVRNASGNKSNVVTLTIIPPPPQLNFALPRQVIAGADGFKMFVTGINFSDGSVVLIEENVIPTTFISPRDIVAAVPASFTATTGARRVKVRNIDGAESDEQTIEVVLPAARIASISPSGTVAGSSDFTLSVTGVNFQNGAMIIFDGTLLATIRVSDTLLQAKVSQSQVSNPGQRSVVVQNDDGQLSNDAVFVVVPDAPIILSIDPQSIIEGAADTTVNLTGERFHSGARTRLIENGRPGRFIDTVFIDRNHLNASMPAVMLRKAGKVFIRVENPDFGISNTVTLDVLIKDPLVINEFLADPPDGLAGDANGDGTRSTSQDEFIEIVNRADEPIDISGFKISDTDSVRHVFAQGTIIPPGEVVVIFGGGAPTGRFGNAAENGLVFKASTGGLSLNNGGDLIRLEDAEGRTIQEVKFTSMEGNANQSINRDPDADGAAFARHTNVALNSARLFSPGTRARGETFTIKPFVRSITPASIQAGSSSFTLTLLGQNFLPGAVILFASNEIETIHRSNSELEAQVGAELIKDGGRKEIRVLNPKGELSSPSQVIVFEDPPRIISISPNSTGTGAINFMVTVTGERLQPGAVVTVKNEIVETRFISREQIVMTIPAKFFTRAGELEILVRNEDGNQSNRVMLRVENGPLITRLSRAKIKTGRGETELILGGIAFKNGTTILVNDSPVHTHFVSETTLTVRIPAEMTREPGALILQALNPDGGRSNKATVKVIE